MKFFLLISILTLLTTSWVQFTPISGDYTFEINERAKYQRQNIENGGYIEIYSVIKENETNVADYILSVSKTYQEISQKGVASEIYQKNFLSTCNCEITSKKLVAYKNFDAVVFGIKFKKGNGVMKGESVHIANGKVLYNINYFTTDKLSEKYQAEFNRTINSLQIYK
jgi:hypothetical protein